MYWRGGDTPCTEPFPVHYRCLMCSIFCPSSPLFYCKSSRVRFVCLVCSFRYNGLATLALAVFGRVRAPRARCGPFERGMHERHGGYPPPLKMVGMGTLCTSPFPVHFDCLMCSVFCLSSPGLIVCLVSGFIEAIGTLSV